MPEIRALLISGLHAVGTQVHSRGAVCGDAFRTVSAMKERGIGEKERKDQSDVDLRVTGWVESCPIHLFRQPDFRQQFGSEQNASGIPISTFITRKMPDRPNRGARLHGLSVYEKQFRKSTKNRPFPSMETGIQGFQAALGSLPSDD
jgi:hypothetical protein